MQGLSGGLVFAAVAALPAALLLLGLLRLGLLLRLLLASSGSIRLQSPLRIESDCSTAYGLHLLLLAHLRLGVLLLGELLQLALGHFLRLLGRCLGSGSGCHLLLLLRSGCLGLRIGTTEMRRRRTTATFPSV